MFAVHNATCNRGSLSLCMTHLSSLFCALPLQPFFSFPCAEAVFLGYFRKHFIFTATSLAPGAPSVLDKGRDFTCLAGGAVETVQSGGFMGGENDFAFHTTELKKKKKNRSVLPMQNGSNQIYVVGLYKTL